MKVNDIIILSVTLLIKDKDSFYFNLNFISNYLNEEKKVAIL